MCESIEKYLNTILRTQLDTLGVSLDFAERIISTVREQMLSCVYHWNDERFRKALLLIGSEEGIQYLPAVGNDIQNFVVMTIRNSEIESLQSKNFVVTGLTQILSDADLKKITSAAIRYFSKIDLAALQKQIEPPITDKYYDLSLHYPVSWSALTKLANTKTQIVNYEKIETRFTNTLNELPVDKEIAAIKNSAISSAARVKVAIDGFSLSVDQQLILLLQYCVAKKCPFVVDSFKFLTRNIKKLLAIMEYLLCNDAKFVTSNYFLSNGHVERRLKLLKAVHSNDSEFDKNMKKTSGLGAMHKTALIAVTKP